MMRAGVLIHNHQHSIRSQCDGFTSNQIKAPQTVLHMAEECEPGWTTVVWHGLVMLGQNPPDNILIYRCPKRQVDLLGNTWTSPGRIAPFHLDNGANDV